MKKVLGLLAGLAIALGLSSCGDDVTKWNTIKEEYQLPVITLKIGDTVQETDWNSAEKKNICKLGINEKQVVNVSVKAAKIVNEESIDITEEVKDSFKWYIGQTQVDEAKNGQTSFDFDTANKNRGSYTFYCSYTAKDANGTDWTYTSKAVEFKLLKAGLNLDVSEDELEFGAKNNTTSVTTTLKVEPYEFEPTAYQVIQIYGNDEGDEDIDLTDKDLENEGVELTFDKNGTYRIKVKAVNESGAAVEEYIEVHVKEITIANTDVSASFTVDKTEVYEGEAMPVVTPAAVKTITYSDDTDKKENITVTKFELKVGAADPQTINAATGSVTLSEAGDLEINVTKIWAKDGDDGEETEYTPQSDAKTVTYIKADGEPTYKAVSTVSAATVKETVDTTFTITPKLEKSQKYTNSETPVTVDISNQISGIVVKLGDTTLTANADGSYNVSDLASGANTLSVTVNGEDSTSATTEVAITYATIDTSKTEYVATVETKTAMSGKAFDFANAWKLEKKTHWTNEDVETTYPKDGITANWEASDAEDGTYTGITTWTPAASETGKWLKVTLKEGDTTLATSKAVNVVVKAVEAGSAVWENNSKAVSTVNGVAVTADTLKSGSSAFVTYDNTSYKYGGKINSDSGKVTFTPSEKGLTYSVTIYYFVASTSSSSNDLNANGVKQTATNIGTQTYKITYEFTPTNEVPSLAFTRAGNKEVDVFKVTWE